ITDSYPNPFKEKKLTVSKKIIDAYLGKVLFSDTIITILTSLGLPTVFNPKTSLFTTSVPSYRADDMNIPQDIVEEVARLYGYHNLPARVQIGTPLSKATHEHYWVDRIKDALLHWGYTEVYTSSLVSKELLEQYGFNPKESVKLRNPLTEEGEYLRPSLLPGVLQAVEENNARKDELKLFELSRIYVAARPWRAQNNAGQWPATTKRQPFEEPLMLTLTLHGGKPEENFFKAKQVVESVLSELHITQYTFQPSVDKTIPIYQLLHPNRLANIVIDTVSIGIIGQAGETIVTDLNFEKLLKHATTKQTFTPIPEHPPVIEDITITLSENTYIGDVIKKIYETSPLIQHVEMVDSYQNNRTLRLTFQHPSKNLTDKEVGNVKNTVLKSIQHMVH
ncbi:hypothetical protein HY468_00710, partial [Candidatus Roizmanbacteria bacterium]|nr:hypothetical protein [Candidatus Roizmanbacteria bacterium]